MIDTISLPKEFCDRMKEMLGIEYEEFLSSYCDTTSYSALRINVLKPNARETIFELLGKLEPVLWCENGFYIDKTKLSGNHPYHMGGLLYFQEPSAMAPVEALGIVENDKVLDLCAAPGGKATAAAEKLNGTGILVANEIIEKRAKILSENIVRMGIKNAIVTNEKPKNLAKKYKSFFNKIIVDAPCSGEGMFKKEPQAVTEWSVEHTESCSDRQKKILEDAISMLCVGGKLVYSTCTFAPCENEGVADWVLSNYPEMRLIPIELEGLSDADGKYVLSKFDLSKAKRIFPHKAKGEGHFLAVFEKIDGECCDYNKTYKCDGEKLYRKFEKEFLNTRLDGEFVSFGERLFLIPIGIDIDKIRVESAGLYLGNLKKDRFEPSHALCLALNRDDFKNTITICEAENFFAGETFNCDKNGWTAVLYNGYPIGWGKASCGILKNHFPKYLRIQRR